MPLQCFVATEAAKGTRTYLWSNFKIQGISEFITLSSALASLWHLSPGPLGYKLCRFLVLKPNYYQELVINIYRGEYPTLEYLCRNA